MAILTKEQITNLFLYEIDQKPEDLADEILLTRSGAVVNTVL